jgi:hypothetical protein
MSAMDRDDLMARPDRPRELVALIQRRSLVFLPLFGALALVGAFGAPGPAAAGRVDPVLVTYLIAFVAMFTLRRWHRRSYGDVRMSDAQRLRGVLFGFAILAALVGLAVVGPRAVPSPLPFTFAAIFAANLVWDPWRVSGHWLVLVAVLLWQSVVHVVGPPSLMTPAVSSMAVGSAGMFAVIVDHLLLVRMIRQPPGGVVIGGQHV